MNVSSVDSTTTAGYLDQGQIDKALATLSPDDLRVQVFQAMMRGDKTLDLTVGGNTVSVLLSDIVNSDGDILSGAVSHLSQQDISHLITVRVPSLVAQESIDRALASIPHDELIQKVSTAIVAGKTDITVSAVDKDNNTQDFVVSIADTIDAKTGNTLYGAFSHLSEQEKDKVVQDLQIDSMIRLGTTFIKEILPPPGGE